MRGTSDGDIWSVWPTLRVVVYEDGFSVEIAWLNWAFIVYEK